MLLRVLFAGLLVFGGFALAGWAIAPVQPLGTAKEIKGDRLAARSEPAEADAPAPRRVPTLTFRRFDGALDSALFDPHVRFASVPATPAPPTGEPQARRDPRKPYRCPRGTPAAKGPPTVDQIAQIQASLRLSPEQEKLWRPVERALMEIARHFEKGNADAKRGRELLSVEHMQTIYWMAGPLVMSLRDSQKDAARALACSMGLAAVAALI